MNGNLNNNKTFRECMVFSYLLKPTGWEAQQIEKVVNKAALFYVEQTVTLHNVLSSVRAQMFLLVIVVS